MDTPSIRRLRAAAATALAVGAAGSLGFMLRGGRHNTSWALPMLFTVWVLSPFAGLMWAYSRSKDWPERRRAALYVVMLAIAAGSLAFYGEAALGPPRAQAASVFVVVPPASWLLMAIAFTGTAAWAKRLGRRVFKGMTVLALLGVTGIVALFFALWLEHRAATTLPAPTGPFAVGRAIYGWTDDAHEDTLAPLPGTKRELVVWIWYPAEAQRDAKTDDYLPAEWRVEIERDRGTLISTFLTRDLAKVYVHSIRDADISRQQRTYPVAVMRAGASSEVANYSTLAEDLASHGYVVVGFDAPYRTSVVVFPDGRVMRRRAENNAELCEEMALAQQYVCANKVLTAWTADAAFVLDRLERFNSADPSGKFTGRLDMTRVGVFGHSFGGATAAQFCHDDSRCKAGIDVDGRPFGSVIQAGLHQPFLFLMGDHGDESDPVSRQIEADIRSIYERLPADGRLRIAIRGAYHFGFSDDGGLLKSHLVLGTLRMLGIVGLDGRRQLAITAHCIHSFFDAYLKGASVSQLTTGSALYPEVQVAKQ